MPPPRSPAPTAAAPPAPLPTPPYRSTGLAGGRAVLLGAVPELAVLSSVLNNVLSDDTRNLLLLDLNFLQEWAGAGCTAGCARCGPSAPSTPCLRRARRSPAAACSPRCGRCNFWWSSCRCSCSLSWRCSSEWPLPGAPRSRRCASRRCRAARAAARIAARLRLAVLAAELQFFGRPADGPAPRPGAASACGPCRARRVMCLIPRREGS